MATNERPVDVPVYDPSEYAIGEKRNGDTTYLELGFRANDCWVAFVLQPDSALEIANAITGWLLDRHHAGATNDDGA